MLHCSLIRLNLEPNDSGCHLRIKPSPLLVLSFGTDLLEAFTNQEIIKVAENEAAKLTHVVLRPPPGTRFSIWGSDVRLDFQKGRETEIVAWLRSWIDMYIEPEALKAQAIAAHTNATSIPTNINHIAKNQLQSLLDNIINNLTIEPNAVTDNGVTDHGKDDEE